MARTHRYNSPSHIKAARGAVNVLASVMLQNGIHMVRIIGALYDRSETPPKLVKLTIRGIGGDRSRFGGFNGKLQHVKDGFETGGTGLLVDGKPVPFSSLYDDAAHKLDRVTDATPSRWTY